MDRREFVKSGAIGVVGAAVSSAVPWFTPEAVFAASNLYRESGKPWKFGVMADTQWPKNLDGQNPGTCAVGIINAVNAEFIKHGVKFAVQVGDLVDKEDDTVNGRVGLRTMPVRANAAQALYDAGIGFFPLRGNHEGSVTAANEFAKLYPQARGYGKHVFGAGEFSSPFASLDGLSYSFDFGGVRLVMLDQFVRADGTGYNDAVTTVVDNNIVDQQPWIDERLSTRRKGTHAFTFAHKNLVGQNHVDTLFGANPSTNAAARNAFIASLQKNGVRYTLGGHDHVHHRSIVTSPDGAASVKELICSSDSYKFYYPAKPSNDATFDSPARELPIAQEVDTFGYYIFTVDGPRMTVDFYASTIGMDYGDPMGVEDKLTSSPTSVAFYKQDTWGYSLNGDEFVVPQGGSYAAVAGAFQGTVARILDGTNQSTGTDAAARPLVKTVNTGWSHPGRREDMIVSHVLTLWGLSDSLALWDETLTGLLPNSNSTAQTDKFVVSMSYAELAAHGVHFSNGKFGIASRNDVGGWVNAVDRNFGGTKQFILGPWNASYALGTYGVNTATKTAWAVVNHEGDFAISRAI